MNPEYLISTNSYNDLEKISTKGEVCVFGRSNVGKSSLINAVLGSKVAFVSKKPGKTVSLNVYRHHKHYTFVDTPGYGFAGRSGHMDSNWAELISTYLLQRKKLKMAYILIDSRRGIMDLDMDMLRFIESFGRSYQIVFTKLDKITSEEKGILISDVLSSDISKLKFLYIPKDGFIFTSSHSSLNISTLRADIERASRT